MGADLPPPSRFDRVCGHFRTSTEDDFRNAHSLRIDFEGDGDWLRPDRQSSLLSLVMRRRCLFLPMELAVIAGLWLGPRRCIVRSRSTSPCQQRAQSRAFPFFARCELFEGREQHFVEFVAHDLNGYLLR
jgi:hypothetical protein